MITGWKNDPKWVEHYEKKKEERLMRQTNLPRSQMAQEQIAAALSDAERSIDLLRRWRSNHEEDGRPILPY